VPVAVQLPLARKRMRMQSTLRPAIRVVVGNSPTLCPGQSRLSSQPVISTIASQFVALRTNFFSLPTKDRTGLLVVLPTNKELPKPVAAIGLGKLLRAKACSR